MLNVAKPYLYWDSENPYLAMKRNPSVSEQFFRGKNILHSQFKKPYSFPGNYYKMENSRNLCEEIKCLPPKRPEPDDSCMLECLGSTGNHQNCVDHCFPNFPEDEPIPAHDCIGNCLGAGGEGDRCRDVCTLSPDLINPFFIEPVNEEVGCYVSCTGSVEVKAGECAQFACSHGIYTSRELEMCEQVLGGTCDVVLTGKYLESYSSTSFCINESAVIGTYPYRVLNLKGCTAEIKVTIIEGCGTPASISGSQQLNVNQSGTYTALDSGGNPVKVTWSIAGGGTISGSNPATSITVNAPSSNANCTNNSTLTATCGSTSVSLSIAHNAVTVNKSAYLKYSCDKTGTCISGGTTYYYDYVEECGAAFCGGVADVRTNQYNCNDETVYDPPICRNVYIEGLSPNCASVDCGNIGGAIPCGSGQGSTTDCFIGRQCDNRTAAMKADGCCPAGLL